jgi:UDPglucose 6-dehydrogenase
VRRLVEGGAIVQAFDPTVIVAGGMRSGPVDGLSHLAADGDGLGLANLVRAFPDAYSACQVAAATVVLTEWDEFRWLDFAKVRDLLAEPNVVEARNLLDPAALRRMGFSYVGMGRP